MYWFRMELKIINRTGNLQTMNIVWRYSERKSVILNYTVNIFVSKGIVSFAVKLIEFESTLLRNKA